MSLSPHELAERLRAYLQTADRRFLDACDPDAVVHATSLDYDAMPNRLVQHGVERLEQLRAANATACPDITYSIGDVTSKGETIAFPWTAKGTHRGPLVWVPPSDREVTIRGTCRIATAEDKVSEIWLDFDVYDLLEQMGRICARPGEHIGDALEVNRRAMERVRAAIVKRETVAAGFGAAHVRAAIRTYSSDFETLTFRFVENDLSRVLARIAELFSAVEIEIDNGTSQGFTTTFRGTLIAARQFHHVFRCGFRAAGDQVAACWLEIMPPPTLKEYMR